MTVTMATDSLASKVAKIMTFVSTTFTATVSRGSKFLDPLVSLQEEELALRTQESNRSEVDTDLDL